ncbi:MAG: hypothetical protein WBD79_21155, partial [Anaerolineae bacterium]
MLRSRWLLSLALLFLLLLLAVGALAATPTPALAESSAPDAPAPWLTSLPQGRPLSGPVPPPTRPPFYWMEPDAPKTHTPPT